MARLSSGQRIVRPSDDGAGLAVGASLKAAAKILTTAIRNVNDGISALNLAGSALDSLTSITERQKELAEQASNGALSNAQRLALHLEASALTSEYNRIVRITKFNGGSLIDAQASSGLSIQAGVGASNAVDVSIGSELDRLVGSGQILSTATRSTASGGYPDAFAAGDINGDGYADLLMASLTSSSGSVEVFFGSASGLAANSSMPRYQSTWSNLARDVVLADFNGDDYLDMSFATFENGSSLNLNFYLNNGSGTFSLSQTVWDGTHATFDAMAAGDVNGDGYDDLVYSTSEGTKISIGNGNGTFRTATTLGSSIRASDISFGDFNGDGRQDMVMSVATGAAQIALGKGDGTFTIRSVPGALAGNAVSSYDFNRDGYLDLVSLDASSARIHLGNGDGTFRLGDSISGTNLWDIAVTDLNADGLGDLAIMGSSLSLRLGDGSGSFALSGSSSSQCRQVVAGDFNGDGVVELAGPVSGSGGGFIYSSRTELVTTAQYLDLTTQSSARSALSVLDAQLNRIVLEQGKIGASSNRIAAAMANISSMQLGYEGARSRIEDVDTAEEAAALVRSRILQDSATAILAQGNQSLSLVTSLLIFR